MLPRSPIQPYALPRSLRPCLLDDGSLTARLIQESAGDFQVEVLRQGHYAPFATESELLKLPLRSRPFLREVLLRGQGQPWVFARTLIPQSTLHGPAGMLTHLGSKPLGAVLFAHPHARRGRIQVYRTASDEAKGYHCDWVRRSLFYLYEKPLLVSEFFLHHYPMLSTDAVEF